MNKTILYALAFAFVICLINATSPLSIVAAGCGLIYCLTTKE